MPEAKSKPALIRKPFTEHGALLPLGIDDGKGNIGRALACREWRMKEERELGAELERIEGNHMGAYVSTVLSTLLTRFGPHDFTTLKPAERRLIITRAWMPDVFFSYLWLRVQTLGPVLSFDLNCPACKHMYPFRANLDTVQVISAESLDAARWVFGVSHPFQARGKTVSNLHLGPIYWSALEALGDKVGRNIGALKAGMIAGSIYKIEGIDGNVFMESDLDEMHKQDIEALTRSIDEHALGPDMALEVECPRCGRPNKSTIEWGHAGFFGGSSG